ncbi:11486_t:CDS:10 [Ambispora leptoticha]|uniref:11486_t:CDS:1 n=1 Tax=Ambispora leptoticha TaxID=144679 RepID=A0A9N9AR21_9GLOM|nr:11486_t:CDS:10 [Ambispora leptoticha]
MNGIDEQPELEEKLVCKNCSIENTRDNIRTRGYLPIENYGLIGNLRTVALCGTDGSIDFFCYPKFDSPSLFLRLLDSEKGGHFSITPKSHTSNKQQYLPSSNILSTRFLSDEGVSQIIDYMHIPEKGQRLQLKPLQPWLIRTLEVVRGQVDFQLELFPAFNYALDSHTTEIVDYAVDSSLVQDLLEEEVPSLSVVGEKRVCFNSKDLKIDLRFICKQGDIGENELPKLDLKIVSRDHFKGPGVVTEFTLKENQQIIFILREIPDTMNSKAYHKNLPLRLIDPPLTMPLMKALFRQTSNFWQNWISHSSYKGRWRENVNRSALTLKLLTYEPTGAVVASPTFGLPEEIGGPRNWDYRYTWVRDSAFTVYALMRLGMTEEAKHYMQFMEKRCLDLNEDGSLNIMYSIDGEKKLTELTLDHLDGYRGSRPVRIGNGAYDHIQLVSYDLWVSVRKLTDYVCDNWRMDDMSIWEVRGKRQNFTYSKIMCWVAVDRALRLSEKRVFPCQKGQRERWMNTRDEIYEEIMQKAWNPERKMFTQSYEAFDALDSAVLIMPLVFFISPTDPRFLSTIQKILLPPEKGGLLVNNLVFRYNYLTTDDGLGGLEGSFSMCTFWLVEALTRAGRYDSVLLERAVFIFEQMIGYTSHLGLFSEEISRSGELLGNFPQAFTHISFISAAFNLDRVLNE